MEKSVDAFRTISEVADDLDLPQHVLRFWETRFAQIRPLKRAGGRRYYRPADVVLLRSIRQLLYDEGYTIKGVQRLLKEKGPRGLREEGPLDVDPANFDEPEAVEGTHDVRRPFEDAAAYDPAPSVPHLASYDRILHEPSAREMLPHDVAPHDLHDARAVDFGPVETDRRPLDRAALSEILATIEDCQRLLIAVRRPRS